MPLIVPLGELEDLALVDAPQVAAGDERGAVNAQGKAIEFALLLAIPCAAASLVIPDLIMRALFARGAFSNADAAAAGQTLAAYATGLIPFVLMRSFVAPSRDAVHKFHEAGIANGGTDEGLPGPRTFTPTAYAAYLRDPCGNKICAYCFAPA